MAAPILLRAAGPAALLATLAFSTPSSAARVPQADEGGGWRWSELELEIWVEPDLASLHVQGKGRLVLRAESSSGPELDLPSSLLQFVGVGSPGAGVELGTRQEAGFPVATARVRCAAPKIRGAEIKVDFECQGVGTSAQFAVNDKAALASWTQAWYPVPRGAPGAALVRSLAAPGLTRFHLPEGWHSVSNGERIACDEPDTELWRVAEPVARSFACAPYAVTAAEVDGRTVGVYRLLSPGGPAEREVRAVAGILRTLEARYGPYPYPTYSVAEVPPGVGDFLGSSEQGFIMVRPVAFAAPDGNLALFGHELAHGWWGNRVSSAGPGSILLDETLAQYSAVVAIEELEGPEAAASFLRFSRPGYVDEQCARGYFDLWRKGGDHPLASLTNEDSAHLLADCKGHWVYHMLRQLIGDEPFFATLRGVIRDFAEEPLTLPEVRARFERAAPDEDVARFFAQWLDRAGAPILELEWSPDGERAQVVVRQVQPGEPYALRLELAVDSAAGRRVHEVELTERETRLTLASDGPPTAVELDPRHRVLLWTSEYGERPGATPGPSK